MVDEATHFRNVLCVLRRGRKLGPRPKQPERATGAAAPGNKEGADTEAGTGPRKSIALALL